MFNSPARTRPSPPAKSPSLHRRRRKQRPGKNLKNFDGLDWCFWRSFWFPLNHTIGYTQATSRGPVLWKPLFFTRHWTRPSQSTHRRGTLVFKENATTPAPIGQNPSDRRAGSKRSLFLTPAGLRQGLRDPIHRRLARAKQGWTAPRRPWRRPPEGLLGPAPLAPRLDDQQGLALALAGSLGKRRPLRWILRKSLELGLGQLVILLVIHRAIRGGN